MTCCWFVVVLAVQYAVGEKLFSMRNAPTCNFVVEMMHAQDFSNSFADDVGSLTSYLPIVLQGVVDTFPGSKFGGCTFTDKPVFPFGFPPEEGFVGDWCLNVTTTVSDATPEDITTALVAGELGGGADRPENQLGALHDVAHKDGLSLWSGDTHSADGYPIVRVVTLSTDALYHVDGDAGGFPYFMNPNDGSAITQCLEEDYPSIAQVDDSLKDNKVYTVFLVGTDEVDVFNGYVDFVDNNLTLAGGTYFVGTDSSEIIDAMEDAFTDMTELTCSTPTLDIVVAQDATWSYQGDKIVLRDALDELATKLALDFMTPKFGLTSFADKPIEPLGNAPSGDYCYRLQQSLTYAKGDFLSAADNVGVRSGRDWWESQLDAIMTSVLDPAVGWRAGNSWNGFDLMKVVVIATDAGYHKAPDAFDNGIALAEHSGGIVNCIGEEYPSVEQMAIVLAANGVSPLFVPTSDIDSIYKNLLKDLELNYGIVGAVEELANLGELTSAVIKGLTTIRSKLVAKGMMRKPFIRASQAKL